MSTELIVYVLTVLAAVVIVLTRLRCAVTRPAPDARHRARTGRVHTIAGVLALVVWAAFLFSGDSVSEDPRASSASWRWCSGG